MNELIFIKQILLSVILGSIVGWQRERKGKAAGLRTYAMVSLGSTLFTLLSIHGFGEGADPTRIASNIITGIGFIGAGTIIHKDGGTGIEGLTTAAGLWASAAVGMAVAVGWYWQAVTATILMFLILLTNKSNYKKVFGKF